MLKNLPKLIIIAVFAIGILIGGIFFYLNKVKPSPTFLSSQEAAERAINYINENILSEGITASLVRVSEENGIYKIHLKIGNNEYDSYITKDGKYFFPEGFDLTLKPNVPEETQPTQEIPKRDRPDVKLFVMSYCPFGNQAENLMKPVVELLGDKIKIELHYVIYSNYGSGYPDYCLDEENRYCSMHGIAELRQDIREICLQKYQPEKLWDFVIQVNKETDLQNIDEKWEGIAEDLGVDISKIKECEEKEAETLLAEEVALNQKEYLVQDPSYHRNQDKITISGSPTLVINGVVYDGSRSAEAYKEAICSGFKNPPEECNQELESKTTTPGGC